MVFSSVRFFGFLVALLVLLAPSYSTRRKKMVLALASCFFYAAWDYRYLVLLLLVSVIDYYAANRIHATDDSRTRRTWLVFSMASNLAILAYFKYTNFFISTLNGLSNSHIRSVEILLPAGISFYTFKSMSYTIDVYRRHLKPATSQLDYTTFVTFFPELIAGPIVRASIFLPQLERPIGPTSARLLLGANAFALGLLKKRLIADRLGAVADPIFANPESYSAISLWCGALAYSLQIYCDFSGYSDMAIGTAKMLGYDLPENFNLPYVSASITEFWRRWHMTLSAWLRDYLYIPLGGNRLGTGRTYLNLMATMLLGGLWHGASWNFVLWGALHGLALALHRFTSHRPGSRRLPRLIAVPATFVFVTLLWVPFRASSFRSAAVYLSGMFRAHGGAVFLPEYLGWGVALVLLGHLGATLRTRPAPARLLAALDGAAATDPISGPYLVFAARTFAGAFFVVTVLGLLFYFAETATSPFIYFQF